MPNGFIKNLEGETIEIVDAQSRSDIAQVKEDLAAKLTEPSGAAVGQYFRVASIDDDGHYVLEACDLPVSTHTNNTLGLVKLGGGFWTASDGKTSLNFATNTDVTNRASNAVLRPYNIPLAVKNAMSSTTDAAWSATEQAAARARIGIVQCTQEEYDLIESPSESTIYVIVG